MNNYYFAFVDENNIVQSVEIVSFEDCSVNGNFSEEIGEIFCIEKFGGNRWISTHRDGSIRKNYAGVGYLYDDINDVFLLPKPTEDAFLDENFEWVIPSEFDLIDITEIDPMPDNTEEVI